MGEVVDLDARRPRAPFRIVHAWSTGHWAILPDGRKGQIVDFPGEGKATLSLWSGLVTIETARLLPADGG